MTAALILGDGDMLVAFPIYFKIFPVTSKNETSDAYFV